MPCIQPGTDEVPGLQPWLLYWNHREASVPPLEGQHLRWRQNISSSPYLPYSSSPSSFCSNTPTHFLPLFLPTTLALICPKHSMYPSCSLSRICCGYCGAYKHQVSTREHRTISICQNLKCPLHKLTMELQPKG